MCKNNAVLAFHPVSLADKERYEICLGMSEERGCEYSFANLYLWGEQQIAFWGGFALLCSRFGKYRVYPHPVGTGDVGGAIDLILEHAAQNGNPKCISGIRPAERERLETVFPRRFAFSQNIGAHDYVYAIDDLAELAGKKYHAKRNHCRRFEATYPDWRVEPLCAENFSHAKEMILQWYAQREEDAPECDFSMEKRAIARAFDAYGALRLEGLLLLSGDEVLAVTLGNCMTETVVDVNFEKALAGVDGAYAMINREFARYIRKKYPTVKYLNREEDMGLEGLRRAKQSYYPHHRIEKFKATPLDGQME